MEIPMGAVGEVVEQIGKAAFRQQVVKESKEHPSFSKPTIEQIVVDHHKKDKGFYGHSISGKSDCFYKNVGNTTGKKRI